MSEEIIEETATSGIKLFTEMPKISIKAEPVLNIFGFHLPNSLLLSMIVLLAFLFIGFIYDSVSKKTKKPAFYYLINFILKSIYSFFHSALKEKTDVFFPLIGSFFFFILLNNWAGLLPGVGSILIKFNEKDHSSYFPLLRGNNADLNTTLALALISVIIIQISGIKYLGFKTYIKKFINLTNPIKFFVGILEIISEISKVISFSFRLFGNIFAGEVLLTVMAFLIPIFISFPFVMLEIFVGFVQALVFSMLTAVFLSSATTANH